VDVSVKFTYSGVDAALDRVEAAIARAAQRGDEGRSAFDDGRGGATTLSCLTNRNYDAIVERPPPGVTISSSAACPHAIRR